ncbi:hypothetical protein [Nostoc sp. UHCC 0251]|uniref:hypothetical protein n=1 Tax=Nostoc sp. UHCC 0251 TaxID=3110240 RepID=UPI002B202674|nr:hypothetical protein [Nostoc sp. UHCC 0251]MEA5626516.1 hypothetical protein [Nostoc sp. UHCC 0251]
MESTLFTTLTPNEEANLSGGNSTTTKIDAKKKAIAFAINNTKQTAVGGDGGKGGNVTIGGGKKSPVFIFKSNVSADGGNGGAATNLNETAQGVAN